jgi:uncharacterized protein YdeI (YjbR/CyaY-like superfamily)
VAKDDLPVLSFLTADLWRDWLTSEHDRSAGVWLKIAKKGAPEPTLSYPQAVEVAICFGWIDGQKGPLDQHYWLQRFTHRKPGSRWSKINTEKVAALTEAGLMHQAGQREVELAKADGRWEAAYPGRRTIEVPDDFRDALAANDAAREFFETVNGVNRFAILYRITSVKRPETRARKITEYVQMLAEHRTLVP